jgi:mono/diheme cytochrome c family protein
MTLHEIFLVVHSWLRWFVLGGLCWVVGRSFVRWLKQSDFDRTDERGQAIAVGLLNLQFMIGLLLYVVLSPLPRAFLADMGAGIKVAPLRFFGMEHALGMLIGTAFVQAGRTRSKRAPTAARRHRSTWIWTLCGLLVLTLSIPWPGRASGRPLLRGLPAAPAASAPASGGVPAPAVCPPAYETRCVACHGRAGRGDGPSASMLFPKPRDLSDPRFARERSDEVLKKVILEGGSALGLSPVMPAHHDLDAAELEALVRCIRSFSQAR